jgi:diguanylate cyclase (GGDEF) domain
MPDIDGIDLAKIFREHPRLRDVPILFMSTEENDRRRMNAKIQGGDDFLNKTIAIDDLLKMVRYRALRYRQSMAEKRSDSLTGLLNHNAIKDLVEGEIDRANRQNQPLSVVLIDIDHFKNVNDTYGHQAGDIVIRKLSNLLNTRLRRYDGVGRYGGEEFMVTLPNTDEQTAAHLINRLRVQFGQSAILTENGSNIFCTFSAGIASFPRFLDLTSLIEAADQHSYVAKANGRNRVVCSEEAAGASTAEPD